MTQFSTTTNEGAIDITMPTSTDLSDYQYHFVKLDGDEEVVASGATEKVIGILQNKPDGSTTRTDAVVRVQGVSKLKINEAVAMGQYLTSTAEAKGEVVASADEEVGAMALTSGDAQNDLIRVLVNHWRSSSAEA
jgi:hypothetical protein